MHCLVVEVELPDAVVTLQPFAFSEVPIPTVGTSADDTPTVSGPRVYLPATSNISTSNAGIGETVQLSKSVVDKLKAMALEKLTKAYPQAVKHIIHTEVIPATLGGFRLASNVSKYSCNLGSPTDIPGLYFGGKDITSAGLMGDIQAGLITANAVLGRFNY